MKKLRKYARFVKGNSAAQQILAQALIDGALEEFWTIYSASTELRLSWGKDLGFISEVYQDAQGEARPLSLPFMVMLGLKKAGEQHPPMICFATKILVLISQRAPETLHTTVGSDLLTALHRNCPMDGSQTSEVNLIEFSEKFHDFEPAQQKKFKTFLSNLLNQQQQKGSQSTQYDKF